jgi:hypothetical protein
MGEPALPPSFEKSLEVAREQVNRDNDGALGAEARLVCGRVTSVSDAAQMRSRRDVVQAGHDAATAGRFVECVVDFLYLIVGNE